MVGAVDRLVGALKIGHGPRSRVATESSASLRLRAPSWFHSRSTNPVVRFWAATFSGPIPSSRGQARRTDVGRRRERACGRGRDARDPDRARGRHRPARLPRGFRVVRPRARRTCGRRRSRGRGRSDDRPPPRRRGLVGGWRPRAHSGASGRMPCSRWSPSSLTRTCCAQRCGGGSPGRRLRRRARRRDPQSRLLERIYAAGGARFRAAAEARAEGLVEGARAA